MVYILKGWVVFEYEGQGEVMLRPGTCVLQPPGIRHHEVKHSDDQINEIVRQLNLGPQQRKLPDRLAILS